MTITPELDACARAMYDRLGYGKPWSLLLPEVRDGYQQAARACLGALLPVSGEISTVLEAAYDAEASRNDFPPGQIDALDTAFTAAIRHIIGETP